MHIPRYQECNGSETLVIFIHGFMGSPNQFDDLVKIVYKKGYSVLTILLPGHNGSYKHFISNGLLEWEAHLQNEINKYKDNYSNIYLVGHSMGGLMALNASIIKSNKICGVFMLSSPIKINYKIKSFFYRIKFIIYPNEHEIKKSYMISNSIEKCFFIYYPLWLKPILQLKKLMRKTKHNLADVFVPVILIHSKNDETVSFKSARILYDGLINTSRKTITLNQSWHAYYTKEEREKICDELLSLIINP